jgi:hypothetical protein
MDFGAKSVGSSGLFLFKSFVSRGEMEKYRCNLFWFNGLGRKWGRGGVSAWFGLGKGSMNWAGISSLWTGRLPFDRTSA